MELMAKMAKTIDGFTQNQTRLVVIIDGLDSCEQDKVLQMLDTVCVCAHVCVRMCAHLVRFQISLVLLALSCFLHLPPFNLNSQITLLRSD